jgi:hypothetical protein
MAVEEERRRAMTFNQVSLRQCVKPDYTRGYVVELECYSADTRSSSPRNTSENLVTKLAYWLPRSIRFDPAAWPSFKRSQAIRPKHARRYPHPTAHHPQAPSAQDQPSHLPSVPASPPLLPCLSAFADSPSFVLLGQTPTS